MKGTWRELEKWISRDVFGYPSIINNFCFDYRHAFRILRKFPSWKWEVRNDGDGEGITCRINDCLVTDEDVPKSISLCTFKYLQRDDWKIIQSEYERKNRDK